MPAISAPNAISSAPAGLDGAVASESSAMVAAVPWRLPAWLLGAVLGAALQLQQPVLWPGGVYGAGLVGAGVGGGGARAGARRRRWGAHAATALAVGAGVLVMFALCGLRAVDYAAQGLAPALEGQDIRVTGVVAAMPQTNEAGTRIRVDVEAARLNGAPVTLPPRIDVAWYGGPFRDAAGTLDLQRPPPALKAGDRWALTVRLKAPHGLRNPHGFDYELWMWEQGVQATGYVRAGPKDEPPEFVAASWRHPVERARQSVRDAILERLAGDQDGSDPARTRVAGLAAGVVLAAAYALFSGWGVPAERTVIMLAAIAVLQLSGRRWPWPQVWLWACAAVVVADPWALAQAGFWLSFVAVGILFATNSIAGSAYPTSARHHFYALIREQWVVTLALTPLTLLLFGQVSVVGFAANLVAIPWVTLVVTPLALGGVLWAPLWSLAALSLQPLAALLQWLALWPWAVVFLPAAPLWAGMLAVAGGALLATRLPWRLRLLAFPLLWPALWWQPVRPAAG